MTKGWRGQRNNPGARPLPRASTRALVLIKGLHTVAWFSIEACMIYLLYAGFVRRSDRTATIAGAIVCGRVSSPSRVDFGVHLQAWQGGLECRAA